MTTTDTTKPAAFMRDSPPSRAALSTWDNEGGAPATSASAEMHARIPSEADAKRLEPVRLFAAQLARRESSIRSIWLVGAPAESDAKPGNKHSLVAFADPPALARLRNLADLHLPGFTVRVVVDGERFEVAWGNVQSAGSLADWDWQRTDDGEASYIESRWTGGTGNRREERLRRRAILAWSP